MCLRYIISHTSAINLGSHFDVYIGRSSPYSLQSLQAINIGLYCATIQWTVRQIAYTPETYVVRYGMHSILLEESEQVESGSDYVTINQVFSVNLTGLRPATKYSFRVFSSNSHSRRYSLQSSFMTKGNGKYVFVDAFFCSC